MGIVNGVEGGGQIAEVKTRTQHKTKSCHPERNIVIGEAGDNMESKDAYQAGTPDSDARHSHRHWMLVSAYSSDSNGAEKMPFLQ